MNTYALASTCIGGSAWAPGIGRYLIEAVLWVTITWSEMKKKNVQAKKVYSMARHAGLSRGSEDFNVSLWQFFT